MFLQRTELTQPQARAPHGIILKVIFFLTDIYQRISQDNATESDSNSTYIFSHLYSNLLPVTSCDHVYFLTLG